MEISTSRGAILHKPDLPGPPTRHASSRRLFRLPTRLFRLPTRLFRLPLPTFRDPPTDFLEAGIWETVHPIREATQVCRIVSESARSQVESKLSSTWTQLEFDLSSNSSIMNDSVVICTKYLVSVCPPVIHPICFEASPPLGDSGWNWRGGMSRAADFALG